MNKTLNTARGIVKALAAGSMIVGVAGCSGHDDAQSDTQANKFTILTNWYAQAEHGGFYQAQAEGLYKKAGLNVNIRMGGPQINPSQLLAAGKAQCAITNDDISTMSAIQQGVPITIVATSFQRVPLALIAHSDVTDFNQLKTRTILLAEDARQAIWPWLQKDKGFNKTQTRPYTFNVQPFMASDQVAQQGYVTSEPYAIQQAGGKFKVFPLGQEGYPSYGNVISCRNEVIKQHPQQVEAFIHASMQGMKDYLANPAQGNALIQKANPNMSSGQLAYGISQLKETGLVEGGDAATQGIGVITPQRLQASWNLAKEVGLVKANTDVSLNQVYTTKFIDQHPVLP